MSVISVINYKGGVGKTTLTSNLAADLAARGMRVLAVDLDPQANLTFSFISEDLWRQEYQDHKTIKSWFDAFIDEGELIDLDKLIIRPEKVSSYTQVPIDLICSHLGLINVDLELAVMLGGASPRQHRNNFIKVYSLLSSGLNKLITAMKDHYDVILIDCPPNFNIVTKNALVASDYYVVPAKPDCLSTLGITQLKLHVDELVKDFNYILTEDMETDFTTKPISPILMGVVFTMVYIKSGEPISAQRQYIEQVYQENIPIFETLIRENKSIYAEAPQYGIPAVLQSASGSTYKEVKRELESLTDEFLRKVGKSL